METPERFWHRKEVSTIPQTKLYKGYVLTKGKESIEPIKNASYHSLSEVENAAEYAGVLNNETILIDIDDSDQADCLMDIVVENNLRCKVIKTTRGRHFLWLNNGVKKCHTHVRLACGLTADIKLGNHNSYEVLKYAEQLRACEWDAPDGDYQELPMWLRPITEGPDFWNAVEGCRNSDLFTYILTLMRNGQSKAESRECIHIINEYILQQPLEDKELEIILRDDAFPADMWVDNHGFHHNRMAEYLRNEFHICRINNELHYYSNGIYVSGRRPIESLMIQIFPEIKKNQRTEVYEYLQSIMPDNLKTSGFERYIAFKNGLIDLKGDDKLLPFSPDIPITNLIPWDYNPEAYDDVLDRAFNGWANGDSDVRQQLEEIIGYCFYRGTKLQKAFMLTGEGSNGKSTYLELLEDILGNDNLTVMDLDEIADKFSTASLRGKLANICDDISSENLSGKALSFFKKLTTGNPVKAEVKYDPDIQNLRPYCKMVFSANKMPSMSGAGVAAITRRWLIVPFTSNFEESPNRRFDLEELLHSETAIQYAINLGIKALKRLLSTNHFTISKQGAKELDDLKESIDIIQQWLSSLCYDTEAEIISYLTREPVNKLHSSYNGYCLNNNIPISEIMVSSQLSKELQRRYHLKSKRQMVNKDKLTFLQKAS